MQDARHPAVGAGRDALATRGGQAVLTFRALVQSDRFDLACHLLVDTCRAGVDVPDNVIPICRWR